MNSDNLSALTVGVGVVALIIGFGVYFNSPELNNAASVQQKNFVPAAIVRRKWHNNKSANRQVAVQAGS